MGICKRTITMQGIGGCTKEVLALPGRAAGTREGFLEEEASDPDIQTMTRSHHF